MLETIALIASGISALTAVTTSLRALGKSREYGDRENTMPRGAFYLYGVVTVIWFALSVIFISPLLIPDEKGASSIGKFPVVVSFLMLSFLLLGIWLKIVLTRK